MLHKRCATTIFEKLPQSQVEHNDEECSFNWNSQQPGIVHGKRSKKKNPETQLTTFPELWSEEEEKK